MTFSIVAWDPGAGPEWGVAVASKFLAVGAMVPFARPGAGALATQSYANLAYGPDGLGLMERGLGAPQAVHELTSSDEHAALRQVGAVDSSGRAATFTGSDCFDWAGGRTGEGFACQGNILTGPDVVDALAETFESTQGDLATRLVAALAAGDERGGDRRGRQSAAVLVVRTGGGYLGGSDTVVDLRVDDHPNPVAELIRLLDTHRLLFPRPGDLEFVAVDRKLASELNGRLRAVGMDPGAGDGYDDRLRHALFEWVGVENLEERWSDEGVIERRVLDLLRHASGDIAVP